MADFKHGTISGYSHFNCRCAECRAAITAYHMARYHGDPEKRQAMRDRQQESYQRRSEAVKARERERYRRKHPPKPPKPIRHGTSGGYHYRGCRCDICRAGAAARQRRYYHAKKTAATGVP